MKLLHFIATNKSSYWIFQKIIRAATTIRRSCDVY